MMLSSIFLGILFAILLHSTKINAGFWIDQENTTLTPALDYNKKHNESSNDVSIYLKSLNQIEASLKELQLGLQRTDEVHQERMKIIEQKIDLLQQAESQKEIFGKKLIALEFTLNHVLSKIVYLSDNCQLMPSVMTSKAAEPPSLGTPVSWQKFSIEIMTRLNNLQRHVQNIERDNCQRRRLVAAAGPLPVAGNVASTILQAPKHNCLESNQNEFYKLEDMLSKLELQLNTLMKPHSLPHEFKQLPNLTRQNGENLARILSYVEEMDKRLEQWTGDEQQHSWQRMLEYCQSVSEELATFAGSSDVLLKRVESLLIEVQTKLAAYAAGIELKSQSKMVENKTLEAPETTTTRTATMTTPRRTTTKSLVSMAQPTKTGCHELTDNLQSDGIYKFAEPELNAAGRDFNERYCVFVTDERAWTVIQRRGPYEVQENFNRTWAEYRNGFGSLEKDFWFGNEFIHLLTYFNNYELLIELEDFNGGKMSILYGTFRLDSEHYNYNLLIDDYKGPGPDSLLYHNFMDFSTYDRRNDKSIDACCPCAIGYGSGWWFDNCSEANLNGIYRDSPLEHNYVGIIWEQWLGDYSLRATRMLMRPKYVNDDENDSMARVREEP